MDHQSSSGLLLKEEDYECALCLRLLFEPSTLRCGHSFCRTCCESLYKQNHAKCPTCRKVLPLIYNSSPDSLSISFTLSKLLEAVFPKEYHQRRLEHEEESNKELIFSCFLPISMLLSQNRAHARGAAREPWGQHHSGKVDLYFSLFG